MGEVAQAWDAQGNSITAPGTSQAPAKQTWDANGKPITATAPTPPTPTQGPLSQLSSWWDKTTEPYTRIDPHQMPHSAGDVVNEIDKGIQNIGGGALGVVLHPLDTLGSMANFALRANPAGEAVDYLRGKPSVAQEMGQQIVQHPLETLESGIGQAGAAPFLEREVKAPFKVAKAIPRIARQGADIIAGTTPRVAADLGETTAADNAASQAKADATNAKLQEQRAADLQKHFEKTQAVRSQNEAAQGVQSRKVALNRGVEQLDPKFQEDLKATEKNVRAQAGAKYDAVRAATAGETIPPESLTDAVNQAETKIQGSSENLKVFRDILSKSPESGDDFVFQGGAKFGPGTPLYESVKASPSGLPSTSQPITFSDLQGYYSELGSQLARGNLPGDVYQATKTLQGSIGDLMQKMAESKGAGDLLTDARSFYSKYMDAFRDSKSPLNRAINAPEAGSPTKGAINKLQGMDQTGIETLARYNPDLAKRANTIRGYQAEAKSLPASAPPVKSEPTLPPAPPPAVADVKKIGLGDIQQAKQEAIQDRADTLAKKGSLVMSGFGGYELLRSAMHGNVGGMIAGAGEIATPYALSKVITSPIIERWLTAPTPSDIAAIPPDIRANLPQIVQAAKAKGIIVHPAILALTQRKQ